MNKFWKAIEWLLLAYIALAVFVAVLAGTVIMLPVIALERCVLRLVRGRARAA